MDLKINSKRSAICVGVRVMRSARHGSTSTFCSVTCMAPSVGMFVNSEIFYVEMFVADILSYNKCENRRSVI